MHTLSLRGCLQEHRLPWVNRVDGSVFAAVPASAGPRAEVAAPTHHHRFQVGGATFPPTNGGLPLLVTVGGGAGRFPFAYGMTDVVVRMLRERYPDRPLSFAGVSSGTMVALIFALGMTAEEVEAHNAETWALLQRPFVTELTHTFLLVRRAVFRLLGRRPDWRERLGHGRFQVGIAEFGRAGFAPRVAERFERPEDVVEAIMCSMHLFAAGRWPLRRYGRTWVADGGFSVHFVHRPALYQSVPIVYSLAIQEGESLSGLFFFDAFPSFDRPKWDRLVRAGSRHAARHADAYLAIADGRADDAVDVWVHEGLSMYRIILAEGERALTRALVTAGEAVRAALFEGPLLLRRAGHAERASPRPAGGRQIVRLAARALAGLIPQTKDRAGRAPPSRRPGAGAGPSG